MKICHVSDWHGRTHRLPAADLYVVTGDMLPNWPLWLVLALDKNHLETVDPLDPKVFEAFRREEFNVLGRKIDRVREQSFQYEWCDKNGFRKTTGIPDDVLVACVRGNHDFIDLSGWIGGNVWEVQDHHTIMSVGDGSTAGLKIGGFRGIPYIGGEWSDETERPDLANVIRELPEDIDLLLSHTPPRGILDNGRHHHGVDELTAWHNRRSYGKPCKAHCFGHVHENAGVLKLGGTTFSNAAQTIQTFEI